MRKFLVEFGLILLLLCLVVTGLSEIMSARTPISTSTPTPTITLTPASTPTTTLNPPATSLDIVEETFCIPNPWAGLSDTTITMKAFQAFERDSYSTYSNEWVKVEKVESSELEPTDIMWNEEESYTPRISKLLMDDKGIGLVCGGEMLLLKATAGDTFQVTVISSEGAIKEISRWLFADDGYWHAINPKTYVEGTKIEYGDKSYFVIASMDETFRVLSYKDHFLSSDLAKMYVTNEGVKIFRDESDHKGEVIFDKKNALMILNNTSDWFPWVMQERWYINSDGSGSRAFYYVP